MVDPNRVELDVLADYVEGLLDADQRQQVQRQIAENPTAAALVAELEALPGLLAAADMEPMPSDVVARVDAAIERESQDRVRTRVPPSSSAGGHRRRWLVPAMVLVATAGIAAIVGPVVIDADRDTSGGSVSGSAAPDGRASSEAPRPLVAPKDSSAAEGAAEPGPTRRPVLTSARFASQVEALFADTEPRTLFEGQSFQTAPVCHGTVESTWRTTILFNGEPAYLVVYDQQGGGQGTRALAFRCRGGAPRILDQQPINLP